MQDDTELSDGEGAGRTVEGYAEQVEVVGARGGGLHLPAG